MGFKNYEKHEFVLETASSIYASKYTKRIKKDSWKKESKNRFDNNKRAILALAKKISDGEYCINVNNRHEFSIDIPVLTENRHGKEIVEYLFYTISWK